MVLKVPLANFAQPGDGILYTSHLTDPLSFLIRVHTYSKWVHVEGIEKVSPEVVAVASRNGKGVRRYPLRVQGAGMLLRPVEDFDLGKATAWFETVNGQGYDWVGLLSFALSAHVGFKDKMYCSEFMGRWWRRGGVTPCHHKYDADRLAPGDLERQPMFEHFDIENGLVIVPASEAQRTLMLA